MKKEEENDFIVHAWTDYRETGRTSLMESYVTGVVFASMSAKKGIDKYGKEAEQKLMAEFSQLLEYQVFHGRKESELTVDEKKGAANMINLVEEKLNRAHKRESGVEGEKRFQWEGSTRFVFQGGNSLPHRVAGRIRNILHYRCNRGEGRGSNGCKGGILKR